MESTDPSQNFSTITQIITINFDTTPDTTEPTYTAPAHHSTSTAEYLEGDGPFTVSYNFNVPSDLVDEGTYIAKPVVLEMHYYIGNTVLDSQTQLTDSDLEALDADVWTKVEDGDIVGVSIEKARVDGPNAETTWKKYIYWRGKDSVGNKNYQFTKFSVTFDFRNPPYPEFELEERVLQITLVLEAYIMTLLTTNLWMNGDSLGALAGWTASAD